MSTFYGRHALALLGAVGACVLSVPSAQAGTDHDRPGSILIFPKVVANANRDTVIEITNSGNMTNEVRCFYLDGDNCRTNDFDLTLTKQQPTQWSAAAGRPVNLLDPFASSGSGLDPGVVPPVNDDFEGALVCVEVVNDAPIAQNKLKGTATIVDNSGADSNTSKYNAIAVTSGTGAADANNTLALDGSEYSQCGRVHRLDFIPDVTPGLDPVIGTDSAVVTNVTVLPCDLDFSRNRPTSITLNAQLWNEFEVASSGPGRTFSCWDSFSIDPASLNPTTFATVEYTSNRPVVMIAESFHSDTNSNATGSAARNVHSSDAASSTIRLSTTP